MSLFMGGIREGDTRLVQIIQPDIIEGHSQTGVKGVLSS